MLYGFDRLSITAGELAFFIYMMRFSIKLAIEWYIRRRDRRVIPMRLPSLDEEASTYVRKRIKRLTIISYLEFSLAVLLALIWPCLLFIFNGFSKVILIYACTILSCLITNICFSLSFSLYLCTAEIWHIFNYLLSKEAKNVSMTTLDFEMIIQKYSDRYDALTDLTAIIASIIRYYATVHICAFLTFINHVYQTLFDDNLKPVYKIYTWIDICQQLMPLWVATFVATNSSRTNQVLHGFYRRFCAKRNQNIDNIDTPISSSNQPSPAYAYLYHRMAHSDAYDNLDIAGLIAITKTAVAAFLFAAINWCAVIMQFRQGATSSDSSVISNSANVTNATFY